MTTISTYDVAPLLRLAEALGVEVVDGCPPDIDTLVTAARELGQVQSLVDGEPCAKDAFDRVFSPEYLQMLQERGVSDVTEFAWAVWCHAKSSAAPFDCDEAIDARLGRVAMRYVDRAAELDIVTDRAESICKEFAQAMGAALEISLPHLKRSSAGSTRGSIPNDQGSSR